MIALNLTANGMEQNLIKEFLQNNVNTVLADKINNGVKITKDNKTLTNKKTLDGFMKYAADKARKNASKGANFACLHHDTVFGWAMHYFEESDIEETLFNEDGTEYKPAIKKVSTPTVTTRPTPYVPPVKKPEPQMSMFDLFSSKKEEELPPPIVEDDEPTKEDIQDAFAELEKEEIVEEKPISPVYKKYLDAQTKHPNQVIVYRLGDFYEVFGDNAVNVADELDLTLTGRDFGFKERVPMIGFPYHVSDAYLNKLTKKHSVYVIENDKEYEYKNNEIPPNIDRETGEILFNDKTADSDILTKIQAIFGDMMEIQL